MSPGEPPPRERPPETAATRRTRQVALATAVGLVLTAAALAGVGTVTVQELDSPSWRASQVIAEPDRAVKLTDTSDFMFYGPADALLRDPPEAALAALAEAGRLTAADGIERRAVLVIVNTILNGNPELELAEQLAGRLVALALDAARRNDAELCRPIALQILVRLDIIAAAEAGDAGALAQVLLGELDEPGVAAALVPRLVPAIVETGAARSFSALDPRLGKISAGREAAVPVMLEALRDRVRPVAASPIALEHLRVFDRDYAATLTATGVEPDAFQQLLRENALWLAAGASRRQVIDRLGALLHDDTPTGVTFSSDHESHLERTRDAAAAAIAALAPEAGLTTPADPGVDPVERSETDRWDAAIERVEAWWRDGVELEPVAFLVVTVRGGPGDDVVVTIDGAAVEASDVRRFGMPYEVRLFGPLPPGPRRVAVREGEAVLVEEAERALPPDGRLDLIVDLRG